ncbi:hypothetical protein CVT24_004025 [Panaeolus cyanescens]|uniref:Ketoreductase domain-containing protein n=1 Tax=Panaeolus cyanescens TaxID=181874 RepID=A0A409Y683_9AGAR|nr:hypothetical protein CVT24_004025 [Panaeolus cyanescens]
MKPVILVTGASKGIGLAVTRFLLLKFNANVIAISRSRTAELYQLNCESLFTVECDISDENALSNAIALGASHYRGIDGLILNAGTLDPLCRIADSTPLQSWKHHFDVNFFSLVTAVKAAVPYLLKSQLGGKIICVSSGAAVKGTPGWGPYNASKAAMNSLVRRDYPTLAEEEPDIVSVAVRPGMVNTNMQATLRAIGSQHMKPEQHSMFVKTFNDGKLVNPEDCGHVIAALSLSAPKSLSGEFVSWDSDECKEFRRADPLWPDASSVKDGRVRPRIDIHHHYFPPDLMKESPRPDLHWKTPPENLPWTADVSLKAMDEMGIDFALLSFPALSGGCVSVANRVASRGRNELVANICRHHPTRFGFFATTPFLDDVQGSIDEICYTFDVLGAHGVSMSSSYGEGSAMSYVGDERYNPIWEELDRRGAVVFLHGSQIPPSTPSPNTLLGVPIVEVPNETFKAAAHLVVTGHRRRFPNVKIILAHLGGSTPFLAPRVAVLSNYRGCTLTPEEILHDFGTFYYETALSSSSVNLSAMEKFVTSDRLLFGTDFPG